MIGYLDMLDEWLATGMAALSRPFLDRHLAFVLARQSPDGGFRGRRDGSDLYYTDFALRVLALTSYRGPAWQRAGAYLTTLPPGGELVTVFNRLNSGRLLRQAGIAVSLDARQTPEGTMGAYGLFLTALCDELAGRPFSLTDETVDALAARQCADGGYAERSDEPAGQTNAVAAVVALLLLRNALPEARVRQAVEFLAAMQAPDGGLRAHAGAPESDLLSSYTGLLTLAGLDSLEKIRLAPVARFLRAVAQPKGGFRASRSDDEADVEYTYYGLATLGILQAYLGELRG